MTLSQADQLTIVHEAARAPSVHNIQPARWRFLNDGTVVLFRAVDRVIPVADPSSHDLQASLGAAFEGMALALSTRGMTLGPPLPNSSAVASQCVPVVSATITASTAKADPLAEWVLHRRSFRGLFDTPTADDARALETVMAPDARLIWGGTTLAELAARHDAATWKFESRPEYHAELWSWLRLSKRDPRYSRDGLNADCLALDRPERWAAARLLVPSRFAFLKRIGVARFLVSESSQVKSASAAVLFVPVKETTPFDVGRRMYRLWLEITGAGLNLAPMSASSDDEETRTALAKQYEIPADRRIANVFRVGRIPAAEVAISPRLPVEELLV